MAEVRDAFDDQIRRGNLVEQQVVPVTRRPADRFGAAGAEPEGRMRLLDRVRLDDDVVEMPALAMVRKPALARPAHPEPAHPPADTPVRPPGGGAKTPEFSGPI